MFFYVQNNVSLSQIVNFDWRFLIHPDISIHSVLPETACEILTDIPEQNLHSQHPAYQCKHHLSQLDINQDYCGQLADSNLAQRILSKTGIGDCKHYALLDLPGPVLIKGNPK